VRAKQLAELQLYQRHLYYLLSAIVGHHRNERARRLGPTPDWRGSLPLQEEVRTNERAGRQPRLQIMRLSNSMSLSRIWPLRHY
jgi:hypothetical protein